MNAAGILLLTAATTAAAESQLIDARSVAGLTPFSIFVLIVFATFVSEDIAAIGAGVLAGQGVISFPLALASAYAGIFVGDVLLFTAGRFLGRPMLRFRIVRFFITDEMIERSSKWLRRQGLTAVFVSRFIFGTRMPLYVTAGILHTSFWWFTLYFSMAVAIWTPILVGASYFLGGQIVVDSIQDWRFMLGGGGLILGLFLVARVVPQLFVRKSRRILWGKIKRRFIWEFWSVRVFYIPVVVGILFLCLKYRRGTVFTAANPAIPGGGVIGESKHSILNMIAASPAAAPFLPKHALLSGESKADAARDFMARNGLAFPVVIKPDAGERGADVSVVRSDEMLAPALAAISGDAIIQEFAPGGEASVFYYRYPDAERGEIFSITRKRFPEVVGDGVSTLEDLILADDRAICLAESYLAQNEPKLDDIPAAGESRMIIDIGTHSRGAIFLDGGDMLTPELESRIDEICRGIDGFCFGRFDIRIASEEEFRRGENFKIVELNGVTSEATNIYDPKFSLFDAYRILFRQWEIAFRIGSLNALLGVQPIGVMELLKLYLRHR